VKRGGKATLSINKFIHTGGGMKKKKGRMGLNNVAKAIAGKRQKGPL